MNKKQIKAGFRLHWLSWLTLMLLSLIMTLIVVPGVVVPVSDEVKATNSLRPWHMLSHGWPCEYMQSDLQSFEPGVVKIAWTSLDAWGVGNQVFSFELTSLMIDLLVAGVIVAGGTLAVEFWRRRRKGAWFSLFDMLVGFALIAIVTRWYQSHASDSAAEAHALAVLSPYEGKASEIDKFSGYAKCAQAPDWLTRLVGGEKQIRFCEHVTQVELFGVPLFDKLYDVPSRRYSAWSVDQVRAIAGFKRAETIKLAGPLHPELPNAVADLTRLRRLVLDYDDYHMKIVSSNMYRKQPVMTMNCVIDCTTYNSNWFKDIRYTNFLRESIEQKVRSFEALQKLGQLDQSITIEVNLGYISHAGWRAIPPMSNLSKISFASREIFIEDLVVLEQFTNLKQVWLSISATKQELENFQRTHPQLELNWEPNSEIASDQVFARRWNSWNLGKWYSKKVQEYSFPFEEKNLDRQNLDLTEFRLTMGRLEMIDVNVDMASVWIVLIGQIDSVDTLNQLLKRCSNLNTLDLSHTEFRLTMEQLEVISANAGLDSVQQVVIGRIDSIETLNQMVKRCSSLRSIDLSHAEFPSEAIDQLILPKQFGLHVRQGDLTVGNLHTLIKKLQLDYLVINDSTLSDVDFDALEEAWPSVVIDHYVSELPAESDERKKNSQEPNLGGG